MRILSSKYILLSLDANFAILISKVSHFALTKVDFLQVPMVAKTTTTQNTKTQQPTTRWHEPGDLFTMASTAAHGSQTPIPAQCASLPHHG